MPPPVPNFGLLNTSFELAVAAAEAAVETSGVPGQVLEAGPWTL